MVMRKGRRDIEKRQTRNGWKETKGNRERGTVREEETERRDSGRDRGEETMVKRQIRETCKERHKRDGGKETEGADREEETERRDGGDETEGRDRGKIQKGDT